jgi:nitric oxide reductase NorE protein
MASDALMADGQVQPAPGPSVHKAPGIWAFIAADCAGFAIFFIVFMSERMKEPSLYDDSARQLDIRLGVINTLILISSSWLVALAITAFEQGKDKRAGRFLLSGLAVGSLFALFKIAEYHAKVSAGITPTTNGFYSFYFILTGVHFLHYLIGLGVLIAMLVSLRKAKNRPDGTSWLESGALYWHMVDLLWLFLFPMLYLLPVR